MNKKFTKTLFSLLTCLILLSLVPVTVNANPGEDFYGYNLESGTWTKGNLGKDYVEGDWVSYQLFMDNASKVWGAPTFSITFDFHQDNTNAIYVDGLDTSVSTGFQYTSTEDLLPDGTQVPSGSGWIHIPTPEAGETWISGPHITAFMDPAPGLTEPANPTGATVADKRSFNVTGLPWDDFTSGYVILFFRAHLALDIIWSKGLESDIPQVLDGDEFETWTNTFHGSSFATGSSRHFFLEYPGVGNKEIPIPIAQYPSTLIDGFKYVNDIPYNGWNITLVANLSLGSGLPPLPYHPPTVQTGYGTFANFTVWPTGYFQFTGLVTGNYTIWEENRTSYVHYDITTSGDGTNVMINIPGGWVRFMLNGGGTEHIDFYNILSEPDIQLSKTPSSSKAEDGTNVTYTYVATNTGNVPLYDVVVYDETFGQQVPMNATTLGTGESAIGTISVVLTSTVTNTANVTANDGFGTEVNATATAYVLVVHPDIDLTKTPSSSKVENGANVTYVYNVTNTGDTTLTGNVTDDIYGLIGNFTLLPGNWMSFTQHHILTANTTNIATAYGTDQLGTEVNATASAYVRVINPDIALTKTPSASKVENGATVYYVYNVTNIGDTALTGNVTDDVYGLVGYFTDLQPGGSTAYNISHVLNETVTNVATAYGTDQLGTEVNATDTATVTVIHPDIMLTKTPSASKVENGATVSYLYNVTNIGDTALTGNITDNVYGTVGYFTDLAPGGWAAFNVSHVLTANTTNIATAYGTDQLGTEVNATASAYIRVINPAIMLTKDVNATKIHAGDAVRYTFNVTNIGDTALLVTVVDDVFFSIVDPIIGPVTLAPGEYFNTTIDVYIGGSGTLTNVANATGTDQLGYNVTATDTVSVRITNPGIMIDKDVNATKIVNGDTVTYTYNVTNTGDVALSGVNVTDDVFGDIATGDTLAVGESKQYTHTTTLSGNTTNTATASGIDQLGATYTDNDTVTVRVINPAISVTKTCEPENQLAPGTITWNITVTNIGDIPLTAVNVTDTRHGYLGSIGMLGVNQTIFFTIVESGLGPGTYYDNATAYGRYQLGVVSDWDDAQCEVHAVYILKQFVNASVLPDGELLGFEAVLVDPEHVNVTGLHSGPYVYFTVRYYFENSLNFLGDDFDGEAHNFTLWDKWGGNLMSLGSPPSEFEPDPYNLLTLEDNSTFAIDPAPIKNTKKSNSWGGAFYRDYVGNGVDISDLASQGEAWITLHTGDQQNTTNPGKGKGTSTDSTSYDTDTVWYIGELGVNESASLILYIAPGKNPGGQLQFSSPGCYVINTGPRVRVYGASYENEDFLYAVSRTNTLTVCVQDFD